MKKNYQAKWRKWIPHPEFHLGVEPYFAFHSALMHEPIDRYEFSYMRIELVIMRKRVFGINLWKKPEAR
jgi:hypothetical protein